MEFNEEEALKRVRDMLKDDDHQVSVETLRKFELFCAEKELYSLSAYFRDKIKTENEKIVKIRGKEKARKKVKEGNIQKC